MNKETEKTIDRGKKKTFFGVAKIFGAFAVVMSIIGGVIFKMFSKSNKKETDDSDV